MVTIVQCCPLTTTTPVFVMGSVAGKILPLNERFFLTLEFLIPSAFGSKYLLSNLEPLRRRPRNVQRRIMSSHSQDTREKESVCVREIVSVCTYVYQTHGERENVCNIEGLRVIE